MKKINSWLLSTNYIQGILVIFNGLMLLEDRYKKQNIVTFQKKLKWEFEIGLPVNETIFKNNSNKKNDILFTYVNVNISKY